MAKFDNWFLRPIQGFTQSKIEKAILNTQLLEVQFSNPLCLFAFIFCLIEVGFKICLVVCLRLTDELSSVSLVFLTGEGRIVSTLVDILPPLSMVFLAGEGMVLNLTEELPPLGIVFFGSEERLGLWLKFSFTGGFLKTLIGLTGKSSTILIGVFFKLFSLAVMKLTWLRPFEKQCVKIIFSWKPDQDCPK